MPSPVAQYWGEIYAHFLARLGQWKHLPICVIQNLPQFSADPAIGYVHYRQGFEETLGTVHALHNKHHTERGTLYIGFREKDGGGGDIFDV